MKVLKIEQNTEEWLEFRKGKSGGSGFKDLWVPGLPTKEKIIAKLEEYQELPPADKKLKVSELAAMLEPQELAALKLSIEPKNRFYQIVAERVARPITPNDYADKLNGAPFSMMARGHILEPEAIAKFCEVTGKKVDTESCVWISDDDDNIYISPDATITDKAGVCREAIEVKCLDSDGVVKVYLTNQIPKEYDAQVIKYFVVNEHLNTLYFVIYTDVIPGLEIQIFEIKRADVAPRIEEAREFEKAVMGLIDKAVDKIERLGF